jgi:4-amino-4-deoxy-L-arabinose transferase-like glycosyltransferase
MRSDSLDWVTKLLRAAMLAGGILFIVVYVVVALVRMGYPFELEWIEGESVNHVMRILSGQKLYVSPSMDFVPYLYTPLYFYVAACITKIIGVGFVPLRLLSFLASLGCFGVIYLLVRRESRNYYSGIIGAGLFAATFIISGQWFDIARPDTLFLFFALLAIYLVRFHVSVLFYIIAGLCVAFSFFTKQTALVIAAPILIASVFVDRRRALWFIATSVILIGGGILLLDRIHDGWFNFYVFKMPSHHYVLKGRYVYFWVQDVLYTLPVAFAVSLVYLVLKLSESDRKAGMFYLLVGVGLVGGAWSARLHSGAYLNVLMPGYAAIAVLFGLGFHRFLGYIKENAGVENLKIPRVFVVFLYLICGIQFASLMYNPYYSVPKRWDVEAGRQFIDMVSRIEGDVLVAHHSYIPTLAGKKSYAHVTCIHDIFRGAEGARISKRIIGEVEEAVQSQKFSAIIMDKDEYIVDISRYYKLRGRVFDTDKVFWPITGLPSRPEYIFVPKRGIEQ